MRGVRSGRYVGASNPAKLMCRPAAGSPLKPKMAAMVPAKRVGTRGSLTFAGSPTFQVAAESRTREAPPKLGRILPSGPGGGDPLLAKRLGRALEPSHHLCVRMNLRFGDRRKRNIERSDLRRDRDVGNRQLGTA